MYLYVFVDNLQSSESPSLDSESSAKPVSPITADELQTTNTTVSPC